MESENINAGVYKTDLDNAEQALAKTTRTLRAKEQALGVDERYELQQLVNCKYMRLRMNALALKLRLRGHLRARKFERSPVERLCLILRNGEGSLFE